MSGFLPSITKEEIAALPRAAFEGEIVVVEKQHQAEEICRYLSKQEVLGFDTESRASFRKGVGNKLSLLQLSVGSKVCYLFRLNRISLDKHLLRILEDKNITKVGLSIPDDIHELNALVRFRPRGFEDLQKIVPAYGIEDLSLVKITAIVMGQRLSKAQRLSNWESVALTDAQKVYAATDAWICSEIYNRLKSIKL